MRRFGALCLCLGLAAPAFAAEPSAEDTSVPWYRWLFLGERAKPVPPKPTGASAKDKAPAGRPTKEAAARSLADEQRVYLERLKAIDRIKQIAHDQRDEELFRRAAELEAKAEEVYNQKSELLSRVSEGRDDRALLERGRDTRPATAERPAPRRRATRGTDR